VPPTAADISALLRVLTAHDVEFVVVGGVGAVIHGAPVSTFDLDIVPSRSAENVARLLTALNTLNARYRDPAGRSILPDAPRLSGQGHSLFMTVSGPLDVLGTIGGGLDYGALLPRSHAIDVGDGLMVQVLDLDALIEVKRQVGRPKDLASIPVLIRTLEELRRKGSD
jgi:hypothetical protein